MASTEPDPHPAPIFTELASALDAAGLRAALIGGAAVNTFEDPRYTKDMDLTVEANGPAISRFTRILEGRGFSLVRDEGAAGASGPDFAQFRRAETQDIVDLIVAKTEFQALVIDRAYRPEGQGLPVATPEDLIVLKLIAGRPVDRSDAYLLARDNPIDWPYVDRWAEEWQVTERLLALKQTLAEDADKKRAGEKD